MVIKSKLVGSIIVVIACLIAYGQITSFSIGRFDEVGMIEQNLPILRDSASIIDVVQQDPFFRDPGLNFYRPMQNVSLLIDAKLGKGKPRAFHVTNLLVHIATSIVLLLAMNLLVNNLTLSTLLAVMFAVNPLFAQAIAWVPGRGDLIVGLCGATMLHRALKDPQLRSFQSVLVILACSTIAVFSKETAILFPVVFIAILFVANTRVDWKNRNLIVILLGMMISSGAYLWARSVIIKKTTPGNKFGIDVLLENLRVVPEILAKNLIPYGLQPMASYTVIATVTGIVLLIGAAVLIVRQQSINNRNAAISGGLWFLIFTVPGAMFHHADGAAAYDYLEHRAYLPAIGLLVVLAGLLANRVTAKQWNSIYGGLGLLAASYLVVAYLHTQNYKTPIAFYNKAVSANSKSSLALTNRGLIREQSGDRDGAIVDYSAALVIDPGYAQAYVNRGNILGAKGLKEASKSDYLNAIRYKPSLFAAHYNLGNYYLNANVLDSAYICYKNAAEHNPTFAQTHALMGMVSSMRGDNSTADIHLSESLRLNPNNAENWLARGKVRYALNNVGAARADWQRSAQMGNSAAAKFLQEIQ